MMTACLARPLIAEVRSYPETESPFDVLAVFDMAGGTVEIHLPCGTAAPIAAAINEAIRVAEAKPAEAA
jgi:hypothetical protein